MLNIQGFGCPAPTPNVGAAYDRTIVQFSVAIDTGPCAIVAWLCGLARRRAEPPRPRGTDDMTQGRIVRERISRADLARMAEDQFGDWIKAVVDLSRGIMAVGGDLHADDEAALLADGSRQQDLWGINLYPGESGSDWIEFDSMINVRPGQGNRSRGVDDERTRTRIREVVGSLLPPE